MAVPGLQRTAPVVLRSIADEWPRCAAPGTLEELARERGEGSAEARRGSKIRDRCAAALVLISSVLNQTPALAASCGGDFDNFIAAFSREASAQNVSPRALATLNGLAPDPRVIALDRRQGVFRQSFEQFALHRINERLAKAQRLMAQHAALLSRIEQRFGVPGSILIAIWGLETDFGIAIGNHPAIPALATLAYDCRRSAMFQGELLAALRIIDRGDLSAAEMRGAWAGEIGQTQFLPSKYIQFAVDFDGNGRRDLIHSVPDVLASTANYLKGYGWQAGGPWTEGTHNFAVLKEWNKAEVYQRTIALFATRLSEPRAASPDVARPSPASTKTKR